MRRLAAVSSFFAAASLAAVPAFAAAQEPNKVASDGVSVELNKLESNGADCQATIVATNAGDKLDSLKLDLVIFDGQGIVAKRIAAELGPLAAKKTVIKTFPVRGIACSSMSRIVLNDVLACSGAGTPVADCLDKLALSSRASATFAK